MFESCFSREESGCDRNYAQVSKSWIKDNFNRRINIFLGTKWFNFIVVSSIISIVRFS